MWVFQCLTATRQTVPLYKVRSKTGRTGWMKNRSKWNATWPWRVNYFPGFSLLTGKRQKVFEGFPRMQTLFFTSFPSFRVSFSHSLTPQTQQRTLKRKLNALFQRDNLSSAEVRVCKIPSHSGSPEGGNKFFFSFLPSLSPSGWITMMAYTACTESFVWQIKKRMLTLDRLWHSVYQTPAAGEVDLNNI